MTSFFDSSFIFISIILQHFFSLLRHSLETQSFKDESLKLFLNFLFLSFFDKKTFVLTKNELC